MSVAAEKVREIPGGAHVSTPNPSSPKGSFIGRMITLAKDYNEPISHLSTLVMSATNAILNSEIIVPVQAVLGLIGSSIGIKEFTSGSTELSQNLRGNVKLLIGLSIPCALYSIAQSVRSFIKADNFEEKEESAYDIVENIGWLGDSTASLLRGLVTNGHVVESVGQVVLPLVLASAVLGSVTIVKHAKQLMKNVRLLDAVKKDPTESIGKRFSHIKKMDDYALKTCFNVESGAELKSTIEKVVSLSKTVFKTDTEILITDSEVLITDIVSDQQEQFLSLLTDRIISKNLSHKLTILSGIVSLVGLAVFVFTTAAPLAFGLFFMGSVVSLVKFFNEKKVQEVFSSQIQAWDTMAIQYHAREQAIA